MLTPEQAQERLKSVHTPDAKDRRSQRVHALPAHLREAMGYCSEETDLWGLQWRGRLDAEERMAQELDALRPGEREMVFAALQPHLAPWMERAWQWATRQPYQISFFRKAYRTPHNRELSAFARGEWLWRFTVGFDAYEPDLMWVAAWAPHVQRPYVEETAVPLLAAAIDSGSKIGDEVFDVLVASVRGEHEVGCIGRHAIGALLAASRPEGWELIERLLLSAQREEGLRQTILECVDLAHPTAFRRMLGLIVENELARFSAVTRALNVWLNYSWDSTSVRTVNDTIVRLLSMLEQPDAREQALAGTDAELAFLALWAYAHEDAVSAIPRAARLLHDPNVEKRFAAATLLASLGLSHAAQALIPAVDDADLRVAICAFSAFVEGFAKDAPHNDLFDRLTRLLPRLPRRKTTTQPILWPWTSFTIDRFSAGRALTIAAASRPARDLFPHLDHLDPAMRTRLAARLKETKTWNAEMQAVLIRLCGDASKMVRDKAIEALADCQLGTDDQEALESLLTRRADDLRRGVLGVLAKQNDDAVLASADRLLASRDEPMRLGGIELLRLLVEAHRCSGQVQERLAALRDRTTLSAAEKNALQALEATPPRADALENALGLMDPAQRTPPHVPQPQDIEFFTPAACECVKSLDALIHQHREASIREPEAGQPGEDLLLGDAHHHFPDALCRYARDDTSVELPLRDTWERWWRERPAELRDRDGLELLRGLVVLNDAIASKQNRGQVFPHRLFATKRRVGKAPVVQYEKVVERLLWWLLKLHPPQGGTDFVLDATEFSFAAVPREELERQIDPGDYRRCDWRHYSLYVGWLLAVRSWRRIAPDQWSPQQHGRFWRLLRWRDEPGTPVHRVRPDLEDMLCAYEAGAVTEADLYDRLLGPRDHWGAQIGELRYLSTRMQPPELKRCPTLARVVDRCRKRILEVELERGETPTVATDAALSLSYIEGAETLVRLAQVLGKRNLIRGYTGFDGSVSGTFSHLIRVCCPVPDDTPEAFAAAARAARIPERRLCEIAVYAPQWGHFIEHALAAPGLADAVWWIHAHTKDTYWRVEQGIRDLWVAEASRRTPLSGADLLDGAVDVAWFRRVFDQVGDTWWNTLHESAKYASGGNGHTRARLFAEAMLGRVSKAELMQRITGKRNQDAVRALGLLPLAEGKAAEADVLDRYKAIQEFLRGSRKFGSQRQASEKRAAAIGLDNLARTAGYPDPLRLQWAMETAALADLADGPVSVEADGVTVSLTITDDGTPELAVRRGERKLKAIPPAVKKKHASVAELAGRMTDLRRQISRIRNSLEQSMCRGDAFSGTELRGLFRHPLIAPMLSRLVLIGEGILGYPVDGGQALRDHAGRLEPVRPTEQLRMAHPHDLLKTEQWHLWQRECFLAERVQPFKQIFRELYVLTSTEQDEGVRSSRYAGHQVHPQQALALLGTRGWVHHPDVGVHRTFHAEGLTACILFENYFYTPGEVEGLTVDAVCFRPRDSWETHPLEKIPPRLFSEAMRDVDLMVSVAHRAGVDPEASASTVEMRSALIRETCAVLSLDNVRVKDRHALVNGTLASYTVHLGSAVVHRQPGGHLCIVPVHAQHRGRLFLPFADDDPKTAEVTSKVLLLARDSEIRDPSILEQIRHPQ